MIDAAETLRKNEVLLIGANGFLGKVLLGLLLDRFRDFKHLHVLIRARRKTAPADRFEQEVLASPALRPIVENVGLDAIRQKISVHAGDLGDPNCGLGEDQLQQLSGRVAIVINCAGLVEFFPPIDDSFLSNVDGVEHVISLCKRLHAKLLHVSTSFVCGETDGLVEETEPIRNYYPRRKGPSDHGFQHEREIAYVRERIREAYDSEGVSRGARRPRSLARKLIDIGCQRAALWGWVNTYTYTKSLGEQLIVAAEDLNYALLRPAIVEAALEFPFPGWVEGGRTAAPLVMMAMGGLRHWAVRKDAAMEVIPVDQVAAAILIAAVMLLHGKAERTYHLSTADINPIYFRSLVDILHNEYRRQKRLGGNGQRRVLSLGLPWGVKVLTPEQARARGRHQQWVLTSLQKWASNARRTAQNAGLPGWEKLRRIATSLRSAGLRAAMRDQALELYQPFMYDNRFIFEAENIRRAWRLLSEKDRSLLPWAPDKIDWEDYWVNNEVAGVLKWTAPAEN